MHSPIVTSRFGAKVVHQNMTMNMTTAAITRNKKEEVNRNMRQGD